MENPTKHKVREAEHFLSMMKQAFEDDNTFSYNLSAFLSAARSITWYMQKQYAHRNGFAEWYCQNKIKMSADPELKYLRDARNEDIKKVTVPSGVTCELPFTADAIFVKEGTPVAEQAKGAKPKPPTQSNPKTIRRFFPKFGQADIIRFSENRLDKLIRIVEECGNRFP